MSNFRESQLTAKLKPLTCLPVAQMAELVDAPASGAGTRKGVEVRVLFWAPNHCFRQFIIVLEKYKRPGFPGFFVENLARIASAALAKRWLFIFCLLFSTSAILETKLSTIVNVQLETQT